MVKISQILRQLILILDEPREVSGKFVLLLYFFPMGQENGSAGNKLGAPGYEIGGYILTANLGVKFNF